SNEEIFQALRIKPDYVYESSFTHWQLNSKLPETEPLANHLYDILKQIAPVRKELQNLQNKIETLFYCSVDYNSDQHGGLVLESRLLTLLAHLGTKLEIHRFQNSKELLVHFPIRNAEEKT
ncbi:MAG: DUF4279 domain-containing protein, partial [Leptospiraceae bacterium]|nr:DUF4279 domain-containing protein [Leptospiraceae bacterium]